MSKSIKRYFLKKGEAKRLLNDFAKSLKENVERITGISPPIERVETEFAEVFIVNDKPLLAKVNDRLIPTLLFEEALGALPRVVVDMRAVPKVCNGADVMAPGVVKVQGAFVKDDLVAVVDERYGKYVAIGIALFNSDEIQTLKRGKVVQNFHFVGDKLWKAIRSLK